MIHCCYVLLLVQWIFQGNTSEWVADFFGDDPKSDRSARHIYTELVKRVRLSVKVKIVRRCHFPDAGRPSQCMVPSVHQCLQLDGDQRASSCIGIFAVLLQLVRWDIRVLQLLRWLQQLQSTMRTSVHGGLIGLLPQVSSMQQRRRACSTNWRYSIARIRDDMNHGCSEISSAQQI